MDILDFRKVPDFISDFKNGFSGKYETQIANIHGYKDDDYTLWRLKEKQLKTLEDLHTRKAKFIVNEACRN